MIYKRKTYIVEAVQYNGEEILFNVPSWLSKAQKDGIIYFEDNDKNKCHLITDDGDVVHVNIGDYIILGIDSCVYRSSPDVFESMYELA